jgi:acyl-CoA reductase-like NAD-dependent aldehyde dehydrogenase
MNRFQKIFDAQKALFASGITRTYEWRVEQLDRMARMIRENEKRFQEAMAKDFKTASQEVIFETQASAGETEVQKSQLKEWMKPVTPVPVSSPTTRIVYRTLWRRADHWSFQRALAAADPPGIGRTRGREHLSSHIE